MFCAFQAPFDSSLCPSLSLAFFKALEAGAVFLQAVFVPGYGVQSPIFQN